MPGPWEKYQSAQPATGGPWEKYATPTNAASTSPVPSSDHPVLDAATNFGKGILKSGIGVMSSADDLAQKYLPSFMTTPIGQSPTADNSQRAVAAAKQMAMPNGAAQNIGKKVGDIGQFLLPTGLEEAGANLGINLGSKIAGQIAGGALNAGIVNKAQGGSFAGGAVGGAAGPVLSEGLPLLKPILQDNAVGRINKVVGALKSDFSRGANPGEGYLKSGLGISSSMHSIAEKAADALEDTGSNIGSAIDSGVGNGIRIPAADAARAIGTPINEAHAILSGPGGGDTGAVEDLAMSYRPVLKNAVDSGGFTPRDLFNTKLNTAKNTSWGDPSNIGIKQARQEITGRLGTLLSDNIPELKNLNSNYQDLTKLANRAEDRATTGRPSFSGVGKGIVKAGSVITGGVAGGIPGMALGLVPSALDSVPVQTALATGLYKGGNALGSGIAKPLGRFAPALVLGGNK